MMRLMLDLDGFEAFLRRRGLAEGTIEIYQHHVAQDGGETTRLRARSLAPKTRRLILGAFRAYGKFLLAGPKTRKAGEELLEELGSIRLPPPTRKRVQKPLPFELHDQLRELIDESDLISDPMRVELGLMAARGIRRGDALRLDKKTAVAALKTGTLSYEVKGGRWIEFGVISTYQKYLELLVEVWRPKTETLSDLIAPSEKAAMLKIARALRRLARQLPLDEYGVSIEDVRPHVLRRTVAVRAFELFDKDIRALMKFMGWTQIQTAYGYVDFVESERLDDIAEQMFG